MCVYEFFASRSIVSATSNDFFSVSSVLLPSQQFIRSFYQPGRFRMRSLYICRAESSTNTFLDRDSAAGWASNDRDIDDIWEVLVEDVVKLGSGTVKREDLVKTSGPLGAILSCFWHYPTFETRRRDFGHVFDKTNPALRFQHDKVGANGWVLKYKIASLSATIIFKVVFHGQKSIPIGNKFRNDLLYLIRS